MITSDKWNVDSILIGVPSNGIPSGRIEKDTKISRETDREIQRETERKRGRESDGTLELLGNTVLSLSPFK